MVLFSGKFSELWIDWVGVSHGYHIHDENIAKKSFLLQENNTSLTIDSSGMRAESLD